MHINLFFLKKLLPIQIAISAFVDILNFSGFESKLCSDGETLEVIVPVNRCDCLSFSGLVKYIFNIRPANLMFSGARNYVTFGGVVDCSLFVVKDIKNTMKVTWLTEQLSFIGVESVSFIDDILSYSLYYMGCYLHMVKITNFCNTYDFVNNTLYPILVKTDNGLVVKLGDSITYLGCLSNVELDKSYEIEVGDCIVFLNFPIENEYFNYIKRVFIKNKAYFTLRDVAGSNVSVLDETLNLIKCLLKKLFCTCSITMYRYIPMVGKLHYVYLRYVTLNSTLRYVYTDAVIETCLHMSTCFFVKSILGWLIFIDNTRLDLCTECSIIDELVRYSGYTIIRKELQNLNFNIINKLDSSHLYVYDDKIRLALSCCGFNEVINYSFTSDWFEFLFFNPNKYKALKIFNPLSNDLVMMRTSLLPGLLLLLSRWSNNNYNKFKLYEIGNCFYVNNFYCIIEVLKITGVYCATVSNVFIEEVLNEDCVSFFEVKKDINCFIKSLSYVSELDYYVGETIYTTSTNCFILRCVDVCVGITGLLSVCITNSFNVKRRVFFFDIMLNLLKLPLTQRYCMTSRYPKVERDLSFVVFKTVCDRELYFILRTIEITDLRDFFIHDVFQIYSKPLITCICIKFSVQSLVRTLSESTIKEILILLLNLLHRAIGALYRF